VRPRAALTALLLGLSGFAIPSRARAEPQVGSALTLGGGAVGLQPSGRAIPVFHLGARGDLLFLRDNPRSMAVGPYVEVTSEAFRAFGVGGGAEWLLPAIQSFPFVLSAGGFARTGLGLSSAWEPGIATSLFWGSRGFNYHSWYGLTAGLFVQARYSLGDSHDTDVIGGLQVDLSVFAYPWVLAFEAIRH
jgi:hypothetical protein